MHRLPLASAYASVYGADPKYTNYTGHFVGCLDYIFFSRPHLQCMSCLDIDNEALLKQNHALPSPLYGSDHISLVAEFEWLPDAA